MAKAALWGIGHATNDCTRRRGSEAAAGRGGSSGAGAQPPSLEPLGICLRLIGEWDSQSREFQGGGMLKEVLRKQAFQRRCEQRQREP